MAVDLVILNGQAYDYLQELRDGITGAMVTANDAMFERKVATNGQHYFVLKAVNHEVIGKSETYSSASAMAKGIASVKRNGPDARVVDLAV